jgi:outer membrane lipopolysaccharide assembly protein LptE/RlpB
MKKRLYLLLLVIGILLLAVGGWTLQGLRRATPAFGS